MSENASSSASLSNGDITFYQQIVASSTGAVLTTFLMTPMDVVKIRLQSQVQPLAKGECFLYSNGLMDHLCTSCSDTAATARCEWFNRPGHFNGVIDAFVKITRHEGIRSLWSGLSPTIVSAIPATVFYFTVYDNLLHTFKRRFGDNALTPLTAGSLARAAAVTVVSPLEMIRTKMQSEQIPLSELKIVLKKSVEKDGYLSLWRGLNATFLRDIPFSAIYWTAYESFKRQMVKKFNRRKTDFTISFVCGAMAGALASIVSHPFDVVKTHRQITLGQTHPMNVKYAQHHIGSAALGKPMMVVMKDIMRVDGVHGLFAGLAPRLMKVAPACAIMIGTYEYLKLRFSQTG